MANVVITPNQIIKTGVGVIQTLVTTQSFYFNNDSRTFVEVYNGHTGASTFVIRGVMNCNQEQLEDVIINVPAKSTINIGLFDPRWFNQTDSNYLGKVKIEPTGDLTGLGVYLGVYRL